MLTFTKVKNLGISVATHAFIQIVTFAARLKRKFNS